MAQTGFTPISIYYSSTASAAPTAGNLVAGELAINTADGKLFYKDSAGVVQVIGTKGGVGSSTTTQVLYNSSGLVVGSANMTFSGTALTLANDASISGLTVGKGGGAVSNNTAIGKLAGNSNSSGAGNVYVGNNAGTASTTPNGNVFVGSGAGLTNITGSNQTYVGEAAGGLTTGTNNTFIGNAAGYVVTTGARNTIIGTYQGNSGGLDIRTSNNNIVLSDGGGNPRLYISNGTGMANFPDASGTVLVGGNQPAFRAVPSSNQTIAYNTVTKLILNSEIFDTNNCYDPTTNYRFTPTVAGYYQVSLQVLVEGTNPRDCLFYTYLYKNGSVNPNSTSAFSHIVGSGGDNTVACSMLIYMNGTTDYLEAYGYQIDYTLASTMVVKPSGTNFQAVLVRTA